MPPLPHTMPFLHAQGITKRFGATTALDRVELAVETGEVHALVGENGSGKSTLMRILAGVLNPDEGTMLLDGQPYAPQSPLAARQSGVAMIHQELSICGDLSVAENIMLGMEEFRPGGILKRAEARRRSREALAQLGHGDLDPDTRAKDLPLATRQLVEIARAVALGSRVVILDEPTSSLTGADAERLFKVIETLKAQGKAILYISHFLDEIHRICDKMTFLRDGNYVGVRPVAGTGDEEIISLMVGRDIEDLYPRSDRPTGDVVLEIANLAGKEKPAAASLQLRKGEVVGIAGLNGSGRTELLRTIFGLDAVKSGDITVGTYVGPRSPANRWKEGVGMLSENRKEEGLFLNLSLAENTVMASLDRPTVKPTQESTDTAGWIDKLRVRCQGPEQAIGELSGGNQQKVAIARMLHRDVDILLLDEPTRGIDVGSKQQIYALIDELALRGKTVLMVSSYLPELLGTCDRIAVMRKGVLSETMIAREATQESLMKVAVG